MSSEKINTITEKSYGIKGTPSTIFLEMQDNIYLSKLFDFTCNISGKEEWTIERDDDTMGMVILDTSIGRFEGSQLKLVDSEFGNTKIRFSWIVLSGELMVESTWTMDAETGVWNRKDWVTNNSSEDIYIYKFLARFVFAPGDYALYSQSNKWMHENQGAWESLSHGNRTLGCRRGRSCQNATPFMALREKSCKNGIAFHHLPTGNWTFKIDMRSMVNHEFAFAVLEMGLEDENMNYRLSPGTCLKSPEMLYHVLPGGIVESAAPVLQRYLLNEIFEKKRFPAPMAYNTWIDDFDSLDTNRLGKHIQAAAKLGCEVFVVDAGWFGEGNNWWDDVGDWREKKDGAFFGRLKEFADEVRAGGLRFGLWMEPERVAPKTPVFLAHPEWFCYGSKGFYYPRLYIPETYSYIYNEVCRLIDTYDAAWIKIDFNFELGIDPTGAEFYDYYVNWYRMLEELREQYKNVYFEGCSSGGMRMDVSTVRRFDGHFLTDTVNPFYVLRITQGALLRLPPGRLTKWLTIRNYQRTKMYDNEVKSVDEHLVTSKNCSWEDIMNINLDFAARVMLTGIFGITGDISNLPEAIMERLAFHIRFFKKWRSFMADATGHLLTSVENRDHDYGWAAIQLQNKENLTGLVFVYRLQDMNGAKRIYLQELDPDAKYKVIDVDGKEGVFTVMDGRNLMNEGLEVKISTINNAAIFEIYAMHQP